MKSLLSVVVLLVLGVTLAACEKTVPTKPDEPAYYSRMARFIGLVSRCGCSDLTADQVLDNYAKALGKQYPPQQVDQMRGYIDVALSEHYNNQMEICLEVCSQKCMVNAVAGPLGGKTIPDVQACAITERNLHLTPGRYTSHP